jgi:hypothetical protein
MDHEAVGGGPVFADLVNQIASQSGQSFEQLAQSIVLLFVDQSHSCVDEVHQGDQTLEPEAVDEGAFPVLVFPMVS